MNCAGARHLHAEGGFYFILIWIPFQILSLYSCWIWEGQQSRFPSTSIIFQTSAQNVSRSLSVQSQTPVCSPRPDGAVHIYWNHGADTDTPINDTHKGLLLIVMSLCSTAAFSQSKANWCQEEWLCVWGTEKETVLFPLISASDPHWLLLNKKSRKEVAKSCWNWREGINLNQAWRSPSLLLYQSSFLFSQTCIFFFTFPCKITDLWSFLFIGSSICQSTLSSCHPSSHSSIHSFIHPSIHSFIHS